jgi:hypothetical protein
VATLIKKLTLRLGDAQFECQLDQAELVDEPTTEDIETFCGTETFATPNYKLNLGGFQDWVMVDSICDIIHQAYVSDPVGELDFEVAVGENGAGGATAKYRSGKCKPTQDLAFGGTAGSPLKFTVTLDVIGKPAETALAAAP